MNTVNKNCEICNQLFTVEVHKTRKYCSKSCNDKAVSTILNANQNGNKNRNWKGGISKNFYHYKKIQKERYPERVKARVKVETAIRSGKLTRGVCEVCGDPKVQGHHEDYNKPLEVKWLCRKHHQELHKGVTVERLELS